MDFLEQRKGLPESGRANRATRSTRQAPRHAAKQVAQGIACPPDPKRPGSPQTPHHAPTAHHRRPPVREAHGFAISFIRTVTVGSGIAPDLLTLRGGSSRRRNGPAGARGLLQPCGATETAGGEFRPALRTLPGVKKLPSPAQAILGLLRHAVTVGRFDRSGRAIFGVCVVRRCIWLTGAVQSPPRPTQQQLRSSA